MSGIPESPYPRPPAQMPTKFGGDMIVGIFVLIIYGCCTAVTALGLAGQGVAARSGFESEMDIQAILSAIATVAILVSGIGITLSKRWGHLVALIFSAIHIVLLVIALPNVEAEVQKAKAADPAQWTNEVTQSAVMVGYAVLGAMLLLQIGLAAFCALRLAGKIGPKPL